MTEIIIGAGASGLACAIRLKQNMPSDEVILLERLDTVGKKILATGNGRCNLSNKHAENYKEVINFFNNIPDNNNINSLYYMCYNQHNIKFSSYVESFGTDLAILLASLGCMM